MYDSLIEQIKGYIKANNAHDISGDGLQFILLNIIANVGKGVQFLGIVTPDFAPEPTLDCPALALGFESGNYESFETVLANGEIGIFYFNGTTWENNKYTIPDGAIGTDQIADDAVTENKIADGAVTENKVADDAITENKIADDAVTENKIADDSISESKIKDDAVTENKIADDAVTENKIADDAITENKIADDAVTTDKIEDEAVVLDKLGNDVKVLFGSMVVEDVEEGIITAQNNHRYNIIEDVENLAVTLPTPIAGRTSKVIVNFIAGFTPTMSIDGGEIPVIYPEIELKHHREYLETITYNGSAWRASLECLTPENCLTFQNKEAFTVQISNGMLHDGRLEYSTNLHDWQIIQGTGIMNSQRNGIRHKVYVRGVDNTYIHGVKLTFPPAEYGISVSNNTQCIGNINTLLNYKNPDNVSYVSAAFRRLFVKAVGLIVAPDLPQTEIASSCYEYMFSGCTSLKHAPDLPATTLPSSCYLEMFNGCTLLESVKMLATTLDSNSLKDWLKNVAAEGTLTKDATMVDLPSGASGIPDGWTVVDV